MNRFVRKWIFRALVLALSGLLTACSIPDDPDPSSSEPQSSPQISDLFQTPEIEPFDYSAGLTEEGLWQDVKALDYMKLPNYIGIVIPKDVHTVEEAELQAEIDALLASYTTVENITDRAVADGDTVNIDYVGSIDGTPFDGGSTEGAGTSVTIGVTSYIDDFLDQLIGHQPGERFDVFVTFPVDYGVEELNGKDAVFDVTINHIEQKVSPELTDAFVAENLSSYGWTTVSEMKEGLQARLRESAEMNYLLEYLFSNTVFEEFPASLVEHQTDLFVNYFEQTAQNSGMDLESYLDYAGGFTSVKELVATYQADIDQNVQFNLIVQGIAEDTSIRIEESDVAEFFVKNYQMDDYSRFADIYGMPYIYMNTLTDHIMAYVRDQALREE